MNFEFCILHSLIVPKGLSNNCHQNPVHLTAIFVQADKLFLWKIIGSVQQAQPIVGFTGFFQGNGHLVAKVPPAHATQGLGNIGPYAGSASQQLLGHYKLPFQTDQVLVCLHNPHRERETLLLHHIAFRQFFPPKNPSSFSMHWL